MDTEWIPKCASATSLKSRLCHSFADIPSASELNCFTSVKTAEALLSTSMPDWFRRSSCYSMTLGRFSLPKHTCVSEVGGSEDNREFGFVFDSYANVRGVIVRRNPEQINGMATFPFPFVPLGFLFALAPLPTIQLRLALSV